MRGFTDLSTRALRAIALWLGLAALSVQAMAPLCLDGFMPPGAAAGSPPMVLCTAHGVRRFHTDGNGRSPSPVDQNVCPLCSAVAHLASFPVPAPILLLLPIAIGRAPEIPLPRPIWLARSAASYVSRAPPTRASPHPV